MSKLKEKVEIFLKKTEAEDRLEDGIHFSYNRLEKILYKRPDLVSDVFESFNLVVQNEENTEATLRHAYEVLGRIFQNKPDLAPKIFDMFSLALKHKKNTESSFNEARYVLKESIHQQPSVLGILSNLLQNEKNDSQFLMYTYSIFDDVLIDDKQSYREAIKKDPTFAHDMLKHSKSRLKNNNTDSKTLECLQRHVAFAFYFHPVYWAESLDIYKEILQHKNCNENILSKAELDLPNFVTPDIPLKPEVFDAFKIWFQHEKQYDLSLSREYWYIFKKLAENQPNHIPDVLNLLKFGLQQEKNGEKSFESGCVSLGKIIEIQPSLQSEVFDTFKDVLQNKHHNDYSLGKVYVVLSNIIVQEQPDFIPKMFEKTQPNLAPKVLELVEVGLQNDKNGSYALAMANGALDNIVQAQPDLAPKAFEVFKFGLQNDKNNDSSLRYAHKVLGSIVKAQPDLAPEVLEVFKVVLQKTSSYGAYDCLEHIAQLRKDLASDVLEVFKVGVQNDNNFNMSLENSYSVLDSIVKARPDLAPNVFEVVKIGLQNECNTSYSLEQARNTLKEIIKQQPDLASELMKTFKSESKNTGKKNNSNVILNKYYQNSKGKE